MYISNLYVRIIKYYNLQKIILLFHNKIIIFKQNYLFNRFNIQI